MTDLLADLQTALGAAYRVERELGGGGMSRVFLAQETALGRNVVIKVLPPEMAAGVNTERFRREIQLAASLQHPHIVPLLTAGAAGNLLFYVMPFLAGDSLRSRLSREGELPVGEVLRVLRDVLDALAHAHDHGVVHRDIKPDNILLTGKHALVTDFGVAKAVSVSTGSSSITSLGMALGTPAYMSPEQAAADPHVDHRADLYAVGALAYEMLCGRPPFTGPTPQAVLAAQVTEAPEPCTARRPAVPAALSALVMRCLEKRAADRWQSADELLAHVEAMVTPIGGTTPPDSPPVLTAGTASATAAAKGIVVLPFANLSPDIDNQFFSDGLTEELIADLSKIRALRVISRTSAMKLKGTDKDLQAIAKELRVQYVLEGSVRKAGNSLRITAQLIDASTDTHLWADKYSGTLDDVFDIQEKLSRTIVDALKLTLTPEEDRHIAERPIEDPRAYEWYLRARQEIWGWTADGLDRASRLLQHGLSTVGENAMLRAALGYVCFQYVNSVVRPEERYLREAEECARKVFELAPGSALGHVLSGLVQYKRGNPQESVRHLTRALAADPNNPETLAWLVYLYAFAGKEAAAAPLVRRLLDLDPLTPVTHNRVGWVAFLQGRFAEALQSFRTMYDLDPHNPFVRWIYGTGLMWNGRTDEAQSIFGLAARDAPESFYAKLGWFLGSALRHDAEAAHRVATDAFKAAVRLDEQNSWEMAVGYALLGEKDEALGWLSNAVNMGFGNYPFLSRIDPYLESVRGEPRFAELMDRVRARWEAFEV